MLAPKSRPLGSQKLLQLLQTGTLKNKLPVQALWRSSWANFWLQDRAQRRPKGAKLDPQVVPDMPPDAPGAPKIAPCALQAAPDMPRTPQSRPKTPQTSLKTAIRCQNLCKTNNPQELYGIL